jgi:uncharacterized protein
MSRPLVLTLPGWQGSGPDHWQSLWEHAHGDLRVEQHDYMRPKRGDWMARLDSVVADVVAPAGQPALLAAHSLGCHLVAAWAAHSRHTRWVAGALLVAPPDPAQADWPPELALWRQPVLQRLPFKALVVASANDPFGSFDAQSALAQAWGADLQAVGHLGHVNAASGLGQWPQGRAWLNGLLQTRLNMPPVANFA